MEEFRCGTPIANTIVAVSDDFGPLPIGATGEVTISGIGLDGPHRPGVVTDYDGRRVFHTGDLGRISKRGL